MGFLRDIGRQVLDALSIDEDILRGLRIRLLVIPIAAAASVSAALLIADEWTAFVVIVSAGAGCGALACATCVYTKAAGQLTWPWEPLSGMSTAGKRAFWRMVILLLMMVGVLSGLPLGLWLR